MKLIPGEWRYFDEELNMPYPWYTKPCLEFLETLDLKGKKVFEYGVGDSTFWWMAKGCEVLGVDANEEWARKTNMMFRNDKQKYVFAPQTGTLYDIIVVDGEWRDDCVMCAVQCINNDGMVIIDNFDQASVPQDWKFTREMMQNHTVKIFKEPNHIDWKTAIVTR